MVLPLRPLRKNDPTYHAIENEFKNGWRHPKKTAELKAIYAVDEQAFARSYLGQRFLDYRATNGGGSRYLFHGTQRACYIGDRSDSLTPCYKSSCYLCSILRQSFKLPDGSSGRRPMFGPGIYTSTVSSKADVYVRNDHIRSHKHAMLICGVVGDRPQVLSSAQSNRCSPDQGYNCVEAKTSNKGGAVAYPETVVYREDAIVPLGMIVYTRKGWG